MKTQRLALRIIPLAALIALTWAPSAHALSVSLTGGVTTPKFTTDRAAGTAYVGKAAPSGGVLLGLGMLELGAIYNTHFVSISTSTTNQDAKYTFLDVPVLLRLSSGRLSIGMGATYSKFLGYKLDSTSVSGLNYDFMAVTSSLRVRLLGSVSLEARYNYMINDESSSDGNNTYFHNSMIGLTVQL